MGDPHELTLNQPIRLQMGDMDLAKKRQPQHATHRIVTGEQTFTPSMLTSPPVVQTQPRRHTRNLNPAWMQPPRRHWLRLHHGKRRVAGEFFLNLALAEIVRSAGVASAYTEISGYGDDAPGVLQINFAGDAEK